MWHQSDGQGEPFGAQNWAGEEEKGGHCILWAKWKMPRAILIVYSTLLFDSYILFSPIKIVLNLHLSFCYLGHMLFGTLNPFVEFFLLSCF